MSERRIGLYLHVPFCDGKCPYCDFYSMPGSEAQKDRYVEAALRMIQTAPPGAKEAETVYFGGGTPTVLGAERLLALLEAVRSRFGEAGEITLEANPRSVTEPMLCRLRAAGFTRISFGLQALDNRTLRTLGRRHSAQEGLRAIEWAGRAGFLHISADLMLAVPGQSAAQIEAAIDRLGETAVDHLSAYLLSIEPRTAFAARYEDPPEDFAAACYLAMAERCEKNGWQQYEISNFARGPAAQSRHNLRYWRCGEYLGIGPAAHSFFDGRRFFLPRDLEAFCGAPDGWALCVEDGAGGGEEERLLLGLRLCEGVAIDGLSAARRAVLRQKLPLLEGQGLLQREGGRIRLTREGFLVSNAVIAALLED